MCLHQSFKTPVIALAQARKPPSRSRACACPFCHSSLCSSPSARHPGRGDSFAPSTSRARMAEHAGPVAFTEAPPRTMPSMCAKGSPARTSCPAAHPSQRCSASLECIRVPAAQLCSRILCEIEHSVLSHAGSQKD